MLALFLFYFIFLKNHYTSVVLQYFLFYSITDVMLCLILDSNEWASSR